MPDYRFCTNLPTFTADEVKDTTGLLEWDTNDRYFDGIDSKFLRELEDYKIGSPIEQTQSEVDPTGVIKPTPLTVLKDQGIVGIYTTLEAIMTPQARSLIGWMPNILGQSYVETA